MGLARHVTVDWHIKYFACAGSPTGAPKLQRSGGPSYKLFASAADFGTEGTEENNGIKPSTRVG